jgi:integrase
MNTKTRRKLPEGVVLRHARSCASRDDGDCSCAPRYQAHAWDPVTRRKVRRTFPTAAAAKSWRASATTAIGRNELRAVRSPTLQVAADELLEGMRSGAIRARGGGNYKPSTIASYDGSLREHVLPRLGRSRLADISRGNLVDLIERMLGDGLGSSTVRNAIIPLHLVFRRAIDRGILTVSPAAKLPLPAPARGRDRIATPAEAEALLGALSKEDRPLWTVALFAGLRSGEIQGLAWSAVDLGEGVIRVERAWDPKAKEFVAPKSRTSRRSVPILAEVRQALLEHRLRSGRRAGLVFGADGEQPFSHSAALARAYGAWKKADLPPLACDFDAHEREGREVPAFGSIGLHEARHFYCSTLLAAGVPPANVSRYAGHHSVAFTLSRYVHARADQAVDDATIVSAYLAKASR